MCQPSIRLTGWHPVQSVSAASLEAYVPVHMGLARTYADFRFHCCMFWRMYDLLQLYEIFVCFLFLALGCSSTPESRGTGACPVTTDLILRVNVRTTTTTTIAAIGTAPHTATALCSYCSHLCPAIHRRNSIGTFFFFFSITFCFPAQLVVRVFALSDSVLSAFRTSRGHGCLPLFPPVHASVFIVNMHGVQLAHFSVFHARRFSSNFARLCCVGFVYSGQGIILSQNSWKFRFGYGCVTEPTKVSGIVQHAIPLPLPATVSGYKGTYPYPGHFYVGVQSSQKLLRSAQKFRVRVWNCCGHLRCTERAPGFWGRLCWSSTCVAHRSYLPGRLRLLAGTQTTARGRLPFKSRSAPRSYRIPQGERQQSQKWFYIRTH